MPFGRLRKAFTSKAGGDNDTPPRDTATSPSTLGADEPRRTSTADDDWERIASPSQSVYSLSSNVDPNYDTATLSAGDEESKPAASLAEATSTPTPPRALFPPIPPPPVYELVAPCCEGYSTNARPPPKSRELVDEVKAISDDIEKLDLDVATVSPSFKLRTAASDETLVDRGVAAPQRVSTSVDAKMKPSQPPSSSPNPIYQFPSFWESRTGRSHGRLWVNPSQVLQRHDPTNLYSTLGLLAKTLADASFEPSMRQLDAASAFWTTTILGKTISSLKWQLAQLEPILSAYRRHWEAHGSGLAAGEIPVGVGLGEWMYEVYRMVVVKQASEINTQALVKLHDAMAEFLPIIRTDFDTFNTRLMQFPSHPTTKDKASASSSARTRLQPPHPAIARIRRQLYSLKDQVRAHYDVLMDQRNKAPQSRIKSIDQLLAALLDVSAAITIVVTNNSSEWIKSDLEARGSNGGGGGAPDIMGYADYVSLDADVLHNIAGRLEQMLQAVEFSARVRVPEFNFPSTSRAKAVAEPVKYMLMDETAMRELLATLEFTMILLVPGASAKSS